MTECISYAENQELSKHLTLSIQADNFFSGWKLYESAKILLSGGSSGNKLHS